MDVSSVTLDSVKSRDGVKVSYKGNKLGYIYEEVKENGEQEYSVFDRNKKKIGSVEFIWLGVNELVNVNNE